jgi:disintegrin and metalloproteinase domain-containing protein 10
MFYISCISMIASEAAFCGNQIVEEGEACDCGYSPKECADVDPKCCSPRTSNGKDEDPNKCGLSPGSSCSPTAGPCCTEGCAYATSRICRKESECTEESFCTGQSSLCPIPGFKENKTLCNEGTQVGKYWNSGALFSKPR